MKVLVTGGAGYVGSHTIHHLVRNGFSPGDLVVLDNLHSGHRDMLPGGVTFVRGDLRSAEDLVAVFAAHRFDAVLHFAALTLVGESMERPQDYYRTNVIGGLNLLEAMRHAVCSKLVFSSTCAVYGATAATPVTEDVPQRPENPYGETKRTFEGMLEWYARCHGVRSVCLRYFNAAGAGYGIGDRQSPPAKLITLTLRSALVPESGELVVNGNNYPTPDGTCIRDYVHVLDLADAHVRALDWLGQPGDGHIRLNVGTGIGASVLEIVRGVEEVSGLRVPLRIGPRRAGDAPALVADASRACAILRWSPVRDLRAIIKDSHDWAARQR